MNMHTRPFQITLALLLLLAAAFAALSAQAAPHPGYVYNTDESAPVRDKDGNCVRTYEWRKEDATKVCNPELLPPPVVAAPAAVPAPAPAAAPAPVAVAAPAAAVAAAPNKKELVFGEAEMFAVNKYEIHSAGKQRLREEREKMMAEMSSVTSMKITGYTDSTGTPEYNKKLSLKRAEAVRDYLVELGGDASKMEVAGMGMDDPVADNKTAAGRAENRRVKIEVFGIAK